MTQDIKKMALKLILDHADKRITDHTEIGGFDLETAMDTHKEIVELCTQVLTNELSFNALKEKLSQT